MPEYLSVNLFHSLGGLADVRVRYAQPVSSALPWWKEPTKDQWQAYIAAWLGWTLDAFDFTIFLLIMLPISQEFGVPLTAVAIIFTLTCGCGCSAPPSPAGWAIGWAARRR